MKKSAFILLLALALWALAACGAGTAQDADSPTDGSAAETAPAAAPEGEDSGTDLILPGDPGYEDDSPTDAGDGAGETDWTALAPEDCVEDLAPFTGMVPRIVLDCPGAEQINAQIEQTFAPLADDPECEGVYYLCGKGAGRVLSVVMVQKGPNDTIFYTPYNLDLVTGQALDGAGLLALLEVDADQLANLEQAVLGEEFTHQFGDVQEETDPAFYDEQYQRTTAPENAELERIWLAGDGQLTFVGRIYGLAGAECYEYALGTGMIF